MSVARTVSPESTPSVKETVPKIRPKLCHHSEQHTRKAWDFFRRLGSPKYWVAPMVDQSELPFRLLCRKYGATGAYTPMLHAKIFSESEKYRDEEFTTCQADRPLFAQFCANDPHFLLAAARHIQHEVDAIDLNLGCPQRIAKRGRYGAFLMEELELVEEMVDYVAENLEVPVTCKIRVFPEMEATLDYARRLERAQCSILAVHGRTRDQKDQKAVRADWEIIRRVKEELSIPVLANGNIRDLYDANLCLKVTGADGVLSAVSLLENPSLFTPLAQLSLQNGSKTPDTDQMAQDPEHHLRKVSLFKEYLDLAKAYPVKLGMVRAHMYRLLGDWLSDFVEIREKLNTQPMADLRLFRDLTLELEARIHETGRLRPIPSKSGQSDDETTADAQSKVDLHSLF